MEREIGQAEQLENQSTGDHGVEPDNLHAQFNQTSLADISRTHDVNNANDSVLKGFGDLSLAGNFMSTSKWFEGSDAAKYEPSNASWATNVQSSIRSNLQKLNA